MKRDILILTSAVITALSLVTATTVYAQVQQPTTQAHGPSAAQIQSDIAKFNSGAAGQFIASVKAKIDAGIAQGKPITTVLTALVQARLISCPLPINPSDPGCTISVPGGMKLPQGLAPSSSLQGLSLPPGFSHVPKVNTPAIAH